MKTKMSKLTAIVLSLLMATSLTGCISKGDTADKSSSSKEESSSTTEGSSSEEATKDPFGKYDPPITITSVRGIGADNTFAEGDDIENNPYTRWMLEDLGIKIKYDWVVDSSQVTTKTATMLASNSLPDFFRAGSADFMNLAKNDAVLDLNGLYDDYVSPLVKSWDDSYPEGFQSGFIDDKHYGIADLNWGIICQPNIIWMRTDWLKASGKEAPKTMDELNELSKIFMEQNPGTYGLALDKSLTGGINTILPLMNAYHAYPKIWIDKDGQLEYGSIQPEVKDGLLELQKMYKEGIIDKEFAVKDSSKVIEDITNNKVGISYACNNIGFWGTFDCVKNDPEAEWLPYDIPKVDDKPVYLQGAWPVGSYIVINKNMKNPEAVIKAMNLFAKGFSEGKFNQPEYQTTAMQSYCPAMQSDPTDTYTSHKAVSVALEKEDPSQLTPVQQQFYDAAILWQRDRDAISNVTSYGRYAQFSKKGAFEYIIPYGDDDRILIDKLAGAVPEGYAKVQSTLLKLEDDVFTKIIMGSDISEFDKFVETWKKLGGEAATTEVNDTFNK